MIALRAAKSALFHGLEGTIRSERLSRYIAWGAREVDEFLDEVKVLALFVEPDTRIDVITRDPSDNRVLESADAGGADYVVTGDGDLLGLQTLAGIPIVTPAQFLAILQLEQL